jgi:hypothetical protein
LVSARERTGVAKTGHGVETRGCFAASRDHDVGFAGEQHHRRYRDRMARRGTGTRDIEARPHEAVLDRHDGRHRVQHDARNEVRRHRPRATLIRAPDLLFEDLDRPLPRRKQNADAGLVDISEPGLGNGFGVASAAAAMPNRSTLP